MPRQFKTILCPTDFSAEAGRAMEYGREFAKASGGLILLAHFVHIATEPYREADGHVLSFDELKQRARAKLEEQRDAHLGGYARHELVLEVGDPREQITELARRRGADLIVISTHGHSSIEHVLVGTVAEAVIHDAPCPMFIVRRGAE